jgi:hypothetical protein
MSKAMALVALLAGAAPLVASAITVGCGTLCERNPDEPPVPYSGGDVNFAGTPSAFYETSGWGGPYLDFPPGRTYRVTHHLGFAPAAFAAYFAFDESPVATSNDGKNRSGSALAAGNQFTIESANAETFDVRNDTCSDVRLRVVAYLPTEGASDAGTPSPVASDASLEAAAP